MAFAGTECSSSPREVGGLHNNQTESAPLCDEDVAFRSVSEDRGNKIVPDEGYVLDGARTIDAPGLFLEIGEAFSDIGGYMGGDLDGLQDFLRQVPRPGTVRWINAATARRRLSSDSWRREEWRQGEIRQNGESDRSLFSAVNAVFQSSGFEVSCDDGGPP